MSELLSSLRTICPELRVIVLSVRQEASQPALAAGAEAFVCKMDPPEKLLAAIEEIRARHCRGSGEPYGPEEQPADGKAARPSAEHRSEGKGELEILGLGGKPEPVPQSGR
jgi:DNA-binding NarL/FixJ family response regulator